MSGLRRSRWLKWLTYAIAAGALVYVVWNLNLADLRQGISNMIWWPVVLAILLQMAPRVVQAWRWGYLLRPVKTRMSVLLHAIYVGTLMNGILPLCPSDLVRGVMVARSTRTGTVRVLSSQAVERAADGVALTLVAWLAIRGLRVPAAVDHALLALVALVGAMMAVGLLMTLLHRRLHGYVDSRRPAGRMGKTLKGASLDMLIGAKAVKAWTMPVSISTGFGMVGMHVAVMWLMLYAYRIDLSLLQAAALFGIITIGTLIPNAPGKIGAWQFFCVLGLGLFGVSATHAAGFSLVAFAIWTVPSLLLGVIALLVSPVSWAELTGGKRPDNKEIQPV
ncbi:MAG: flippase-like domain-containing protein [Thermoleophilia bacterium]|nr:flippase-like domain-containing protein [Thermoleophilia bacterium]